MAGRRARSGGGACSPRLASAPRSQTSTLSSAREPIGFDLAVFERAASDANAKAARRLCTAFSGVAAELRSHARKRAATFVQQFLAHISVGLRLWRQSDYARETPHDRVTKQLFGARRWRPRKNSRSHNRVKRRAAFKRCAAATRRLRRRRQDDGRRHETQAARSSQFGVCTQNGRSPVRAATAVKRRRRLHAERRAFNRIKVATRERRAKTVSWRLESPAADHWRVCKRRNSTKTCRRATNDASKLLVFASQVGLINAGTRRATRRASVENEPCDSRARARN